MMKRFISIFVLFAVGACAASPLYTGEYRRVKPDLSSSVPRDSNGDPILPPNQ